MRPFCALLGTLLLVAEAGACQRFFVFGDTPYSDFAEGAVRRLMTQATAAEPDFLVHIGDIKSGSSPCDDERLERRVALLAEGSLPLVFSFGDNEWTDCHREAAGGYDPLERLSRLREIVHGSGDRLKLERLDIVHSAGDDFPEIYHFSCGKTLFVNLHVVGSRNHYARKKPAMMAAFEARDQANAVTLRAVQAAIEADRPTAMVIFFHGNPVFERRRPFPWYAGVIGELKTLIASARLPVLLVHGDTHEHRVDRPFQSDEDPALSRVIRLEVPGFPATAGILVDIDPATTEVFRMERLSDLTEPSVDG